MFRFLFPVPGLCLLAAASLHAAALPTSAASSAQAEQTLTTAPAWFEPDATARGFVSRNALGVMSVGTNEATYTAGGGGVRMRLLGSNPIAKLEGHKLLTSQSNYMLGNKKELWRGNVRHFGSVRGLDVYPGIDIVYRFSGKALEFDFAVSPGADPAAIRLAFEGAGAPRINAGGDLVFPNGILQKRPIAYQGSGELRRQVASNYRIGSNGEVRVELQPYDTSQALIVDPVIFSSYVGGDRNEIAKAITVAKNGTVWITGSSASYYGLAIPNTALQNSTNGGKDVFVAGFTPDSTGALKLTYWTQLGGTQNEEATCIAVDDNLFVYIGGSTASLDFPRAGTALQADYGGGIDAFVAVIRPDLGPDALAWSQFYGGDKDDIVTALTVDQAGSIYVTGNSQSTTLTGAGDYSVQSQNRGGVEAFFVKAIPSDPTQSLSYTTFFGGASSDFATGIALDAKGNVWISGYTSSSDFPVTDASTLNSTTDLFLTRLNINKSGLDGLEFCTYIGGSGLDIATGMKIDSTGQLWIFGYTLSTDFPFVKGARSKIAGGSDGFLLRFDPSKTSASESITYSTLIGGNATDVIYGITFLAGGSVALAGYTFSSDFPIIGEPQPKKTIGGAKAFVMRLDPALGADGITYSTTVAGSLNDVATAVATDSRGFLYLAGYTFSTDFPVTNGTTKQSSGGQSQSFILSTRPN